MLVEDAAQDLARRLNEIGLGQFLARGNQVIRPDVGFFVPLTMVSAGRGRPYEVERAIHTAEGDEAPVLFAESFWPGGLELLASADANYVDKTRLHIRLLAPDMMVHVVDGQEVIPTPPQPTRLDLGGGASVVAVEMLQHPSAGFRVTELAAAVHSSPATVQRVFHGLESEGLLVASGRGPQKVRRLMDDSGSALLERYATDAPRDRRRAIRLRVLGDAPDDVIATVAHGLDSDHIKYALTGSVAAALEALAVTGVQFPVEFWVNGPCSADALAKAVGGIASEEAPNVVFWRAGSRGPMVGTRVIDGVRRASPFRVYADLLADPRRGKEQAAYYRESVIGF
jgi:hypothetical protein